MKRPILRCAILSFLLILFTVSLFVFSDPVTQVGYTLLTADTGQRAPVASALFTVTSPDGTLVSQAGVGATEPLSSGRIFVDQDGVETGVALVNPSSQAATISLVLRASSGDEFARQTMPLEAGKHVALFVSQIFSNMPARFTGSFSFESTQKLAAITLRQSKNSRDEVLYTTLPVVDLSKPATTETVVFPQIAAGEGYTTQVILINSTNQSQSGQIHLYGDDGNPISLQAGSSEGTQFSYQVPKAGTYGIEFSSSRLETGYAVVVPDPGTTAPNGSAVFRFFRNGYVVTEAGVGASQATTSARIFVDNADCYTGVALVNRAGQSCNAAFTLIDRNGLAVETQTRTLPPNGHLAIFAHELFPGLSNKFTGLMEISTTTLVAPITLKLVVNTRLDLVYTTFPVADLTRLPSAASMVFPQIAFGGGFSTRLILINTDTAKAATGRLSFYQSNSSPMSIPFGNQIGSQFPYQLSQGGGTQFFPGNTARPASIVFWDSQADRVISEVAVNEGNRIKVPLLVLDETGTPRDDFTLNYLSINPEVATVDAAGYVTAWKKGFSTLTVSSSGVVATGTIMVVDVQPMASSNVWPMPRGIVQDMARGVYLAVPQEHAIVYVREPGQTPESYAGIRGIAGLKNDLRLQSLFKNPAFLALNQAQGTIYVSDGANNVIRKVQAGPTGKVETFAGTGAAGSSDGGPLSAQFNNPQGLALDNRGYLWVADSGNHTIRRVNLTTGATGTIAGKAGVIGWVDGIGEQARFNSPMGIAAEPDFSIIPEARKPVSVIVADTGNGVIRRVKETGEVETLRGASQMSQGHGLLADEPAPGPIQFRSPAGVVVDPFGNIYVSEPDRARVSAILTNGDVVAAAEARTFIGPAGMAVTQSGKVVVADRDRAALALAYGEPQITRITPDKVGVKGGERVTIAGSNLAPDSIVIVAGTEIKTTTVSDSQTIQFSVPPGLASGLTTLTVQNRSGLAQRQFLVEGAPLSELPPGCITTLAGGATYAGDGSLAVRAEVRDPYAVAFDPAGNAFFVDRESHRIRKVAADTEIITTVAGTGSEGFSGDGGPATAAELALPSGVAVDSAGNLFIADTGNARIRKVASESGLITTVAGTGAQGSSGDGGPAIAARLSGPWSVAVDSAGNLLIADYYEHRVRMIAAGTGIISTVAGTGERGFSGDGGLATAAKLLWPIGITADLGGNLFIAEEGNQRIRKVSAATGIIITAAGTGERGFSGDGGPATAAKVNLDGGLAADSAGNLFIADWGNNRIRKIAASTGIISTVAGTGEAGFSGDGGPATAGKLYSPTGAAVDTAGNLIIADSSNRRIRWVAASGVITTLAGIGKQDSSGDAGPATAARLYWPTDVASDAAGNVFIADLKNHRVRKVAAGTAVITTVAGTGEEGFSGDGGPATAAKLNWPDGLALQSAAGLFVADGLNSRIRTITFASGIISTVAGIGVQGFSGDGGPATAARLFWPRGLASDAAGNLYIADWGNNRIRKFAVGTGIIITTAGNGESGFSGDGGPATEARLDSPVGVAVDAAGNLFIADYYNRRVRKVAGATGTITTVAGGGSSFEDGGPATAARLNSPYGVAVDATGNMFIAESDLNRIRKVAANTGIITTVAGTGVKGFSGDGGPAAAAELNYPVAVCVDSLGNLFIADSRNDRVRVIRGPIP